MAEIPENIKAEIRKNVDWIWTEAGDAAPASLKAWLVPIPVGGGITSVRGPLGPRTCGNYAVLWALAGDRKKALEWLNVCQSHNESVKAQFNQYSEYTVDYAKSQHEKDAVTQLGILTAGMSFPVPLHYITGVLNALKGHNPDRNPAHLQPPKVIKTSDERATGGGRLGK
ncbi:hypothetical protein K3G63_04615 [Hymenobacter sp. HSC-4F20]|uniref:hypothetical protein n=1 Tax=Hymenobacter sp. HSC-4F20 TaxID=2864135 RepID=UPI001C7354E7|nr:hypothetical protein [Hymenobacter sp. HSC-4F20]MBX0289706.1 hypothetical protein [Hymenobacter sp. HSC-4F20]